MAGISHPIFANHLLEEWRILSTLDDYKIDSLLFRRPSCSCLIDLPEWEDLCQDVAVVHVRTIQKLNSFNKIVLLD